MSDQSPTGESRGSRASVQAALAEARKNHAAAAELLRKHANIPGLVARAEKSLAHFAALITQLEGQCPP